jgi:hypothetical protein
MTADEKERLALLIGQRARELQTELAALTPSDFRVTLLAQFGEETISGTTWPTRGIMQEALIRLTEKWKKKRAH